VDGAAVDVSLLCFGNNGSEPARLNGVTVAAINPDLTTGLDLTVALPLRENRDGAFLGIQKSGPFDVPGDIARVWMAERANPNGRSNAEILKPYWNGDDLTGRPRWGMTPDIDPGSRASVACGSGDRGRGGASYPADLIVRVPDVRPGFPDRVLPRNDAAAQILARRTLTALSNEAQTGSPKRTAPLMTQWRPLMAGRPAFPSLIKQLAQAERQSASLRLTRSPPSLGSAAPRSRIHCARPATRASLR
jgi:hypothetical protein